MYLNGDFMPLAKAKISVLDRGLVFGEGVYERVPGPLACQVDTLYQTFIYQVMRA